MLRAPIIGLISGECDMQARFTNCLSRLIAVCLAALLPPYSQTPKFSFFARHTARQILVRSDSGAV